VEVVDRHLVGRDEELRRLARLLDTPEDLPRTAVLVGEAGIGKTSLWLAACDAAEERGYRLVACRPAETETRFSFAGLSDLIGDVLAETLPELPDPQRRALEHALLLADHDGAPVDEHRVAVAFLSTLRTLAAKRSLLVAVDDVNWLDAPSLAVLRFALARLRAERVGAVVASRDRVPDWLRRTGGLLVEIEVGPLSLGALHELLHARLGTPFARPALVRLWETSGGNPFYALELARAVERRGGRIEPGDELPLPDNLEQLVEERLDSVERPAREVTQVVALLAEPTARLVEAALGQAAEQGLADALAVRLLELDGERIRFSHPLLASGVVSRMPPKTRRALHARLADIVSDGEERARHLALAATAPDPTVAGALEAAARRADSRGAPAAAAELAQQALRLTLPGDGATVRRRTVEAAEALYEAGDSERSIGLLEHVLTGVPSGPDRASILLRLAAIRTWATGPREGIARFHEALAQTGGDAELEAEIHLELADALRFATGIGSALPHAEAAIAASDRAGSNELLCRALAVRGLIHFKLGRGIDTEVMARAVALEESLALPAAEWNPKTVLCDQLFWSHDLAAARTLAEEVRGGLHEREDPYETDLLWYLALIEWRAGSWPRASVLADEAVALAEQTGRSELGPVIEWPRTLIAAHRGFMEEARLSAEDALARAEAAGIGTASAAHAWVLGFIELSLGRPVDALSSLRKARDLRESVGHGEPGQQWEAPDLLDALVAAGDLEEAEAEANRLERRGRALDRPWALAMAVRCRALLVAAAGDPVGAQDLFEQALAEHGRTEDPFQLARTLLVQGATQRRAKQRSAARETLHKAMRIFDDLGSPLWAEQARVELGRIGGRAPSPDALTPTERRVAALVAEGQTNREVAAALFVGERTVESHLTHIYAKLGVRSRTELATRLH
jgi:ATP/maltotriose-dependent transcriptional regulator MalT